MYGDEKEIKNKLLEEFMQDSEVSLAAKNWLKKF
jgi:hypothetical protein